MNVDDGNKIESEANEKFCAYFCHSFCNGFKERLEKPQLQNYLDDLS
jgi:hypothetical protein